MAGALTLGLTTSAARAGTTTSIDPQLFVCSGSPCTTPNDPYAINPASINVGFQGSHTSISPLLIIVGESGTKDPTISLPVGVNLKAAGNYYGAATNGMSGGELDGTLTSASKDAYTSVGLTAGSGGGASESFVNWTTSPYPNGQTNPDTGVSSFNLYVYAIDFALDNTGDSGQNSPINIDFSNLDIGSYVIAYNCAMAGTSCTDGDIGATPFTVAGADTTFVFPPILEPGSLALLGSALAGFGLIRRRRKSS